MFKGKYYKNIQSILKKNKVLFSSITLFSIIAIIYLIFFWNTNKKTIEKFENVKTVTYYYMDGCKYCDLFSPEWDKFVDNYDGEIKFSKKNMKDAREDLKKYNIDGFPTVIIIDEQGNNSKYEGGRTAKELAEYFQ